MTNIVDFPNNPSVGDTHVVGSVEYKWDGEKWGTVSRGFRDHNDTTNRDAVGAHDEIYTRRVNYADAVLESADVGTVYEFPDLGWPRYEVVGPGDTGGLYLPSLSSTKFKLILDGVFNTKYVGGLSGDATDLLQTLSTLSNGIEIRFSPDDDFSVTGEINFPSPKSVDFGGCKISFDAASTATPLSIGSEIATEVHETTSSLSELYQNFTISDASSLSVGDWIAIWNPVDSSWSGFRTNYRQGEYAKIADIQGNTLYLDAPLQDSYPAGTKIYKLDTSKTRVTGEVTITNTGAYGTCSGLRVNQLVDSDESGLSVSLFNGTSALTNFRCINLTGDGVRAFQKADQVSGLNYGLVTSSCQNVKLHGEFHADRHGSTIGGGGQDGAAINRDILITGRVTTSGLGGVQAADIHGNAERCGYGGYLCGYILGGHDSYILEGTKIVSPTDGISAVTGSEMKSTKHSVRKAVIRQLGTPSQRGVIELGGNTSPINSNTVLGGVLDFTGTDVEGLDTTQGAIRLRNRGANVDISVNLEGFKANTPNSSNAFVFSEVSGSPIRVVDFTDSEAWKEGVSSGGTQEYIGIVQFGSGSISVDTSGNIFLESVTYDSQMLAGRNYSISFNTDASVIGTKLAVSYAYDVDRDGFVAAVASSDRVNFDGSQTVDFQYSVVCR